MVDNIMQLVERHKINPNHKYFYDVDKLCFLSKNLYNRANYIIRQEFINTSKEKQKRLRKHAIWIRYNDIQKLLQETNDVDYYALPTKVSQQVLKLLDKNWKSFFGTIKDWNKYPEKYKGRPCLPKYKNKLYGRNTLVYTIQAISGKKLKNGTINPSGTNFIFNTKQKNINQIRIVPKSNHYVLEIIYEKKIKKSKLNKNKIAGGDIGVNNLIAVTSNDREFRPFLINGRNIKSINQY